MEELFKAETPENGKVDRHVYDNVMIKLAEARDEINSLNREIYELQQKLDEKEHADRVVINTKEKIKNIEIYFV